MCAGEVYLASSIASDTACCRRRWPVCDPGPEFYCPPVQDGTQRRPVRRRADSTRTGHLVEVTGQITENFCMGSITERTSTRKIAKARRAATARLAKDHDELMHRLYDVQRASPEAVNVGVNASAQWTLTSSPRATHKPSTTGTPGCCDHGGSRSLSTKPGSTATG